MPYRSAEITVEEFAELKRTRRDSSFMVLEFSREFVGTVEAIEEREESLVVILTSGEFRSFASEERLSIMEHFPKKRRRGRS